MPPIIIHAFIFHWYLPLFAIAFDYFILSFHDICHYLLFHCFHYIIIYFFHLSFHISRHFHYTEFSLHYSSSLLRISHHYAHCHYFPLNSFFIIFIFITPSFSIDAICSHALRYYWCRCFHFTIFWCPHYASRRLRLFSLFRHPYYFSLFSPSISFLTFMDISSSRSFYIIIFSFSSPLSSYAYSIFSLTHSPLVILPSIAFSFFIISLFHIFFILSSFFIWRPSFLLYLWYISPSSILIISSLFHYISFHIDFHILIRYWILFSISFSILPPSFIFIFFLFHHFRSAFSIDSFSFLFLH